MTTIQPVLLISVLCFAALTIIAAGIGLYFISKGQAKAHQGLIDAMLLLMYQMLILLCMLEQLWEIIVCGLLLNVVLAVSLIVKDRQNGAERPR
mgnify:CR=1 FL=1